MLSVNVYNNLCTAMLSLSEDTWSKIFFSRSHKGFKIFETTITQLIIYDLLNLKRKTNLPIEIFESIDENTNGNDIELYIKCGEDYNFYPIQAKIIYKSGKYPQMNHPGQISSLINYAKQKGGMPLYLLYNYYPNWSPEQLNTCPELTHLKSFGCTIVDAHFIYRNFLRRNEITNKEMWRIPHFLDLHETIAKPWNSLVCCGCKSFQFNIPSSEQSLKKYSKSEIDDTSKWQILSLEQPAKSDKRYYKILEETISIKKNSNKEKTKTEFLPKFKFIFGDK